MDEHKPNSFQRIHPSDDKVFQTIRENPNDQTMETLTTLDSGVGRDQNNVRRDVAKIETLMSRDNRHDIEITNGPTGVFGVGLEEAIKHFQKDNQLKQDGLITPDGETISALSVRSQNINKEVHKRERQLERLNAADQYLTIIQDNENKHYKFTNDLSEKLFDPSSRNKMMRAMGLFAKKNAYKLEAIGDDLFGGSSDARMKAVKNFIIRRQNNINREIEFIKSLEEE